MTAEQLQTARAAHWRQNQSPILTLEDAVGWFSRHPLSLYLPRRAQLPAPAPSFVEACLGDANADPPHAAIEHANGLLSRLVRSDFVIGLNLLGAPGEQPDFLAHGEVLPFLVSLRGERDWKHAPGSSAIHKASPLVVELWKVLEQAGPLTAAGLREKLGRELTESAVARALSELWQSLRAIPVPQPDGPAIWELLETHHGNAISKGSGTSQVTAISLLVSMYLQSVYAASGDEIEIFLSPLASRSRIREAVRGLSATRQIHSLSMEAQTYYFLEDGLPKFADEEPERPKVVTPRRPRVVAEPKPARAGIPEWAKVRQPNRAPDNAALPARSGAPEKFVPRPNRPPASRPFAPAAPAGRGSAKPRPDRGDFQRRKNSRPAYGHRPGGEGFSQKQRASAPEPPRTRTKERWRNTPGKPGYQPNRARFQSGAPLASRSRPEGSPANRSPVNRGSSRPARPFSPTGERRGPSGAGRPRPPRGGESSAPRGGTSRPKFQDRGRGTQGFERPQRRPPASGTFASHGQEIPRPEIARTARPQRARPAFGRPGNGKPGTGRPPGNTRPPQTGRPPRTGPSKTGWPRAAATGRPPSAWSNKAGGGRPPRKRPSFGAAPGPGAGAPGFLKPRPGRGPGAKGARRSPANGNPASKDLGKKRPEA